MSQPFSSSSSNRRNSADSSWEPVGQSSSEIYVVCLDCGKHFEYDWATMRVVK